MVQEAFRSTLNDTLANAANAYWDLVALRESQRVAAEAVVVAERQHKEDLERVELGVMTPLDALTSESQLASARVQVVTAETSVRRQEALLKTLISRENSGALDAPSLEPTERIDLADDIQIPSTGSGIADCPRRPCVYSAGRARARESTHCRAVHQEKPAAGVGGFTSVKPMCTGLAPGTPAALRRLGAVGVLRSTRSGSRGRFLS